MNIAETPRALIDQLRSWFFAKDRSIYLADNTFYFLPLAAGYLSMAFISEIVLTASAASVTFSNIPQGFRHLFLICQARSDVVAEVDNLVLQLNGDLSNSYDTLVFITNTAATTTTAFRATNTLRFGSTEGIASRAKTFASSWGFVFNYAQAIEEKQVIGISGVFGNLSTDADLAINIRSSHWRNLNVVTSLVLLPGTGPNFVSGSTFQLYGIL